MSSIVLFDDKKIAAAAGRAWMFVPRMRSEWRKMKSVLFIRKSIKICVLDAVPAKRLAVIKRNLWCRSLKQSMQLHRTMTICCESLHLVEHLLSLQRMCWKKDGVVYGAALPLENGKLEPKHLRIDTVERLPELQGSKYVQSAIGDTYAQAKRSVGWKRVLFLERPVRLQA